MNNRRSVSSAGALSNTRRQSGFRLAMAALLAIGSPALHAAVYTYDANTATAGQQDGNGVWDSTTADFLDSTNTDVAFGNTFADTAVFGVGTATTTASVLTVNTVNVNAMQINALGTGGTYTFNGGTITFGGTTPTITNNNTAGLDGRNGVGTTISSLLAGTAGLTFAGTGTLALTNTANTFSGGITLSGTTVRVAADTSLGDAGNAITVTASSTLGADGAALTLGRNVAINTGAKFFLDPQLNGSSGAAIPATAVLTSNGVISGAGTLVLGASNREALVILNGTNTVTGGISIASTARAVDGVSLPSGSNLSLEGNGSSGNTSQGVLETSGTFSRALGTGAGQVQWGGNLSGFGFSLTNGGFSAVGGLLTVNLGGAGATVTSGSGGFTSGELRLQDFNATAALTFVNPINLSGAARSISVLSAQPATLTGVLSSTGGGVTKNGAGTLILSAANTYTGVTTLNSGTLSTGAAGSFANGGTASSIGAATNAAANLILTGGSVLQYASTGAAESTDHLFQIGTTAATTASLDASGTNPITFSNTGAITLGTTNLTRTLTLTGTNTGANTFAPLIADNGTGLTSLAKSGAGSWTLAGANTFTGGTTLSGGTLVAASTSAIGTSTTLSKLTFSGTTAIYDIATAGSDVAIPVSIGTGNAGTIASDVNTAGAGINHTLGAITLSNVTLNVISGPNVLSGSPSITLGTINLSSGSAGSTATLKPTSANLILNGAVTAANTSKILDLDGTSQGNFVKATIQGSSGNVVTVTKTNTSTWEFDAGNTYGGGTTISGGTLALGSNGTTNGAFGGGAVVDNAAVAFKNTTTTLAVANLISGTGTVTQSGTGTATLTGANTYSGGTTISAGTLALGTGGTFGTGTVTDNAAVAFSNNTALTVANAISGTGTVTQTGTGTTTLTGANTYSGGTTIGSSNNTTANTSVLLITNGSALGTGAVTIPGAGSAFSELQLQGGITTPTGNTLSLSGARDVSMGGPILENISGLNTFQGAINIAGAGGNGANIQSDAGTLTLSGNLTSISGSREYVFQGAGNTVVSGVINTASTIGIIKNGTGTLTLTGANTYGISSVSAGTLALGDGGTFGTGAVTNNATVAFSNATTALTVGNVISGTGAVIQNGAGTTTLTGANTFGGLTTINAGTLAASAPTGQALGGTTGIAINAGTLLLGTVNQVNVAAPITMGTVTPTSGTLNVAAGASQGTASTVVGGTPDGTTSVAGLGALTLNNTSTLTFSGAATTLVFGLFTPNGNVLNVTGYSNGTATADGLNSGGANDDRLVFSNGGGANAATTSFAFNGNAAGVGVTEIPLDGNFYEVAFMSAVPEPSTWLGGLLSLGMVGFAQRRRLGAWLSLARLS